MKWIALFHQILPVTGYHFGDELVIDEASVSGYAAAVAVLDHARNLAQERVQPGIRLNLPASSRLVGIARAHGAAELGTYSWQIHIPDAAALLLALRPALEHRIGKSLFSGWTGSVCVSFYTKGLALAFDHGRLRGVEERPRPDDREICMPFAAFVPLVLGCRSVDELREHYPDVGAEGIWKLMLETLFPKRESFIFPTY